MSETEWQDIKSAPLDGTFVDLWAAERDRYENYRITDCYFQDGRWLHHRTIYDADTLDDLAPLYNASHWMPRPNAPSLTESGPDSGDSRPAATNATPSSPPIKPEQQE